VNDRRVKRLLVSSHILSAWLRDGCPGIAPCRDGLPADAEIVGVMFDPFRGEIDFLIRSDEFDEAGEGVLPPVAPSPMFARTHASPEPSLN
jgi:hypothetical protein